jgi:hypothetical protein
MIFVVLSTLNLAIAIYVGFKLLDWSVSEAFYSSLPKFLVYWGVRSWLAYLLAVVVFGAVAFTVVTSTVLYLQFTLPFILKVTT